MDNWKLSTSLGADSQSRRMDSLCRNGNKENLDNLSIPNLFGFTFNSETISKAIEIARRLPFEAVEHRFINGTPDDVISRIEAFVKPGAEHFVLTLPVRHSDYILNS